MATNKHTGPPADSASLQNGTTRSDTLQAGSAFLQPIGLIHQVTNPTCNVTAKALLFFNA